LKLGEDKRAEKESLYLNERVIQNIFFVDHVGFSPWDVFSQIRFVGVDGFGATMKELVSIRSGLSIVNVHGLRLYGVQKWQGLIRVLGSFFL
jgi:hypothetical protein